ncbi:IS3 family transposase [Pseudoramibacter alactolyticus]|uniref:IS3 family transposase n=1 Tax=Pseudoramibacter alactolyticus TaxID=113287 RepID=UPI003D7FCE75
MERLCSYLHVSRSAYYRWLKNPESISEKKNQEIFDKILKIHENHPDMGYRRIRDELNRRYDTDVNDKRVLRLCRKNHVQSAIKWKPKSCTKSAKDPAHRTDSEKSSSDDSNGISCSLQDCSIKNTVS